MSSQVDADWSKVSPPFDVTFGRRNDRLRHRTHRSAVQQIRNFLQQSHANPTVLTMA